MNQNNKPTLADQLGNSLPIISSTARAAFVTSHFILALGSGFAIMYLIVGSVAAHLGQWPSYALAWAGSLIWYKAVENPLRRFMLFAWAYILTDKDERAKLSANLKRTGRASAWVTGLLLVTTLSLSLLINVDVAQAVTTEQDSTAELDQSGAVTNSYNKDVDLLREQLADARARDARRISEAKQEAAQWIGQAEASKGNAMRDLLHKGNSWASSQLRPAIKKATTRGERHVEQAKAATEAPAIRQQLTGYVGNRSAARDTVATMTAGLVNARRSDFANNLNRRNGMLMVAVLFVLAVFVFSGRLLVLACLETGESIEDQEPGEGVAKVAARMTARLNAKLGQKLDERFGDKLVLTPVRADNNAFVSNLSAPSPAPVSPIVSRPAPKTAVQNKKETKTRTTDLSAKVSVQTSALVGNLTVVIDGIEYTAKQTTDKLRKYYSRSKTAKTKKSRDSNADKYATIKAATEQYFVFKESGKTVKIEQR